MIEREILETRDKMTVGRMMTVRAEQVNLREREELYSKQRKKE